MTIPFLVTPAYAVPTFWAGLHYTTIRTTRQGRTQAHACARYFMPTDIVGSVPSGLPRTYLVLLLRLASSHHVTGTSRRTLAGTSSCVRWLICQTSVVIRRHSGTLMRPSCGSLPALLRSKVHALLRTLDAKDLRGGDGFHRSVKLTVPALRQPVKSFFQDSEKFFRNFAGHRARSRQDGCHPVRKSFVPEKPSHVKQSFKFFSHFYFQLFQVLMHMPRIFFKSSRILASYVSLFVLNCNARAHVCGHVRKIVLYASKWPGIGPRIAERAFSIS